MAARKLNSGASPSSITRSRTLRILAPMGSRSWARLDPSRYGSSQWCSRTTYRPSSSADSATQASQSSQAFPHSSRILALPGAGCAVVRLRPRDASSLPSVPPVSSPSRATRRSRPRSSSARIAHASTRWISSSDNPWETSSSSARSSARSAGWLFRVPRALAVTPSPPRQPLPVGRSRCRRCNAHPALSSGGYLSLTLRHGRSRSRQGAGPRRASYARTASGHPRDPRLVLRDPHRTSGRLQSRDGH
jgi:hypothetical protein